MGLSKDKVINALIAGVTGAVTLGGLAPYAMIVASTVERGVRAIASVGLIKFLTSLPPAPGSGGLGGVGPSLLGTALLTLLSTLAGVPLAFCLALLVTEFPGNPVSRVLRALVKGLLELPTIVAGMVVYTLVVIPMGTPSILAGSLALTIVMLPYVTTYFETYLGGVPKHYREAGYAIGLSKAGVALRVAAPIARKGLLVGVLVGVSRALGETAPLLFTLGSARYYYPTTVLGPGDSVSLLIYNFAMMPYPNLREVAWGAALILLASYLLVSLAIQLGVRGVET